MSPERGKTPPPDPSSAETRPPGKGPAVEAAGRTGPLSIEVTHGRGSTGASVLMEGHELIIGREEGDIRIEDLLVSRRHASIRRDEDGQAVLKDLDSTNGTFLNGALLLAPAKLQDGDDIRIGPSHLRVRIGEDREPDHP